MKHTIKVIAVFAIIGCCNLALFAQDNISDKMFNELRSIDDVTYLSFSKSLIDFVDFDIDSDEDEHKVTGDLEEVKLVIFKPEQKPEKSFRDQVLLHLKKGKYTLVEEDDDEKDDTEVWVYRKGKRVYECHVIFQGEQNGVLLSFFGDFKVEDVDKLSNKIEDYRD